MPSLPRPFLLTFALLLAGITFTAAAPIKNVLFLVSDDLGSYVAPAGVEQARVRLSDLGCEGSAEAVIHVVEKLEAGDGRPDAYRLI